jgi:hypothetical protein
MRQTVQAGKGSSDPFVIRALHGRRFCETISEGKKSV